MHLIMVFLTQIARKITAFNKIQKIYVHIINIFFLIKNNIMKFCHFKQKMAIWDSAKWTRQYGIWQSGTNSNV